LKLSLQVVGIVADLHNLTFIPHLVHKLLAGVVGSLDKKYPSVHAETVVDVKDAQLAPF